MAANGISTLANKNLRQEAKLTLAETDRTGGLKVGRPWAT